MQPKGATHPRRRPCWRSPRSVGKQMTYPTFEYRTIKLQEKNKWKCYTFLLPLSAFNCLYNFCMNNNQERALLHQPPRHVYNDDRETTAAKFSIKGYLAFLASYLAISLLTMLAIGCLFCLFLAIRFLDDVMHKVIPRRLWRIVRKRIAEIDWSDTLVRIGVRLTSIAEWERDNRSIYTQHFSELGGDRLHALLLSVTNFLARR